MDFIEDFIIRRICLAIKCANELGKELKWVQSGSDGLDDSDITNLDYEFGPDRASEFDPLRIRQTTWKNFKEGKVMCRVFFSGLAKIVGFFPEPSIIGPDDIPLTLWSKILKAFCHKNWAKSSPRIRIYFVASVIPREFPANGRPITPENINGGYCYPCKKELSVYIFRGEDATRVLIHELFHAFCTDRFEIGLDLVEARTEAWAEIAWCCFLAEGDEKLAKEYFLKQVAWVLGQNMNVAKYIGRRGVETAEFPWRYTLGKEHIFRRWLLGKLPPPVNTGNSLRLTSPDIVEHVFRDNWQFEKSKKLI